MASRLFFLCARNSGRALLAASLLQSQAGNRFEIWSAPIPIPGRMLAVVSQKK